MIHIPKFASTSALISFWVVLSVFMTTVLILMYAYNILTTNGIIACLAGFSVFLLFTFVKKPHFLKAGYNYYNAFNRRVIIQLINIWVTGVVFYIILFVNKIYGNKLQLSMKESVETLWHPKTIGHLIAENDSNGVAVDDFEAGSWLTKVYRWSKNTGNLWIIALLPYMLIISFTNRGEEENSMPTDTYTLY
jgi:hypothetical protein